VDLEMSGLLWLADGRVGAFDCGFAGPHRQWLEVAGTEGVIRVADMWGPDERAAFTIERDGREPEGGRAPGFGRIGCVPGDFSRAVVGGGAGRPDPEEAVRTLLVLDALAESAGEGREVEV